MASRRPHLASIVEDKWHSRAERVLRARGWRTRALGYTGYGSPEQVRVLGRIKLAPSGKDSHGEPVEEKADPVRQLRGYDERRGWRSFTTPPPAVNAAVEVRVGNKVANCRTDRSGYVDVVVEKHGLKPGWHEATIRSDDSDTATAPVLIIGPETRYGIISDLDDTCISTMLPRMMIAAWNTLVVHSQARTAVPGMAPFYRELRQMYDDAPVIYLSTGAWNTADTLEDFLQRAGFPKGPMLLTDWGPTNTGWFRSGQEHKRATLRRLWREFPHVHWMLIGDDGQHDPKIYGDFAEDHPDVVEFIALRELTPAEQVLSHGLPVRNEDLLPSESINATTPVYRAPDGYSLAARIKAKHEAEQDREARRPSLRRIAAHNTRRRRR